MSTSPLGVVYGAAEKLGLGQQSAVPADQAAPGPLMATLDAWKVSAPTAKALGWSWAPDSRQLRGLRGTAKSRPFAGVTGPRLTPEGERGWFFAAEPPLEGGAILTPTPTNVLCVLPGADLASPDPLYLAADPIEAARLWEAGRQAAWINGANGWRGGDRKLLTELTVNGGRTVVLCPPSRTWGDRKEFDGWRALADELAARELVVRVRTELNDVAAGVALAPGKRPPTARQLMAQNARGELLGGAQVLHKSPFAKALLRADKLRATGVSYISRSAGLSAATVTRAVINCLEHVAVGPGGPWVYDRGVWVPGWSREEGKGGAIGVVLARLLEDDYRPSHEATVLALLGRQPDLPLIAAHPGTDGWGNVLNFQNGLLELATGELGPHRPEVLSTWQLPIPYRPEASCPMFRRFLAQVLPADMLEEVDGVAAWQEDVGYLLLPGNPLQIAFLLRGAGRNGKGVYMDVAGALVGEGAVSTLSLQDIVSADRSRFRMAQLTGSALNLCGELDPRFLRSTAAFKALTGGDPITLEEKGKKPFAYTVWSTPVFSANEDFSADDGSVAHFERWQVRSFPNFIAAEQRDPVLARRIIGEELPGVAAAAVVGLQALLNRGHFRDAASAQAEKYQFQKYSDHVLRFIEERVVVDAGASGPRPLFYESYKSWCEDEGIKNPVPSQKLLATLREYAARRGVRVEERKSGGTFHLSGAGLAAFGPA